jgi:hypothetical protein
MTGLRTGHRVLLSDLAGRLLGFLRLARRGKPDRGFSGGPEKRDAFSYSKASPPRDRFKSPEGAGIPREQALENQEPEAFERKRTL